MALPYHRICQVGLLLSLALAASAESTRAANEGPEATVLAFNAALTQRKLDAALATVAPGAIQYTFTAAHRGMPAPSSLTTDLKVHWSTVAALLFNVTSAYTRSPEILETRVTGTLATVWARLSTETVAKDGNRNRESFDELYILQRTPDGWKIAGMADDRATDNIAVGAP